MERFVLQGATVGRGINVWRDLSDNADRGIVHIQMWYVYSLVERNSEISSQHQRLIRHGQWLCHCPCMNYNRIQIDATGPT